jgi:hypothetical protein
MVNHTPNTEPANKASARYQWGMPSDFSGWAVFALGVFFVLFGLPLLIGGVWLIVLAGSWY